MPAGRDLSSSHNVTFYGTFAAVDQNLNMYGQQLMSR
jgi:hypothetical protein